MTHDTVRQAKKLRRPAAETPRGRRCSAVCDVGGLRNCTSLIPSVMGVIWFLFISCRASCGVGR